MTGKQTAKHGVPAAPPVTGDGDEKLVRDAHALAAEYGLCDFGGEGGDFHSTECEAVTRGAGLGIARGRAIGAREDELMLFLAESVRDAFECDCEFEGDTCPCEGDGDDNEGCWRCQANAAIEARRAGREGK